MPPFLRPKNAIDNVIGATARIEGNVYFSNCLRLEGSISGNVVALSDRVGTLVVSERARVEGDVRAPHIVISGSITGTIYATEMLELQASSRVKGDVHYKSITMHHGALVEGRLVHRDEIEVKQPVEMKLA